MPPYPRFDPTFETAAGSAFSALAPRIASLRGEIYPLHIGDTWMEPAPSLRIENLSVSGEPRPHKYANPNGNPTLIAALVEKVRKKNGLQIDGPGSIYVAPGATGALFAAATATISAGDEVLILSPFWPLVRGMVVARNATPVEVPVVHLNLDAIALRREIAAYVTPKTAAIYVNTPHNPTGHVFSEDQLAAVVGVAKDHGLWIWADEVYEDYVYSGDHVSVAKMAPDRTLTAFSFSKAYGMTGYRCGYLVGPKHIIGLARRAMTYVWYSTPTPSQYLAERALADGAAWLADAKAAYWKAGQAAAQRLGVPEPRGSTFLFLDVASRLDERGLMGLMEDCLTDNLVIASGDSFGKDFGSWVRLCYTCVDPEKTERGIARFAARIGR